MEMALCCLIFVAGAVVTAASPLKAFSVELPACRKFMLPFPARNRRPMPPPPLLRGGATRGLSSRLDNYLDKIFDGADTNHDGSISTSETYELVLKMYVQINRKAPIPPPSREKVEELFRDADVDRSGRLSRDEFHKLALVLASRATTRVVAHKAVTIICAPLLAVEVVRLLLGRKWVRELASRVIPAGMSDTKFAGIVKTPEFWRTVLTVTFVVTLGNITLALVNAALDFRDKKKTSSDKES